MPSSPSRQQKAKSQSSKKAVSKASDFKRVKGVDLELPSGNVCKVRRVGIESLMAENVFGDSLMPIIQKSMDNAKGGKPVEVDLKPEDIMGDPQRMKEILDSFNKVTALVVVEPKCRYHRREVKPGEWEVIPESERDEEIVYTDEVDMQDKSFIFQFVVGGSSDLASFREQSGEGLADVLDGEDVSVSA